MTTAMDTNMTSRKRINLTTHPIVICEESGGFFFYLSSIAGTVSPEHMENQKAKRATPICTTNTRRRKKKPGAQI
jgi:hypothetical protein